MKQFELYLMEMSSGHPALIGRTTDPHLVGKMRELLGLQHRRKLLLLESDDPDADLLGTESDDSLIQ